MILFYTIGYCKEKNYSGDLISFFFFNLMLFMKICMVLYVIMKTYTSVQVEDTEMSHL